MHTRRFTTGLTLKDKGLRSPRNQTRRGYQTSRRLANIVGNMGAKGPVTPEQLQQTLQASCTAEDMAASGCADVLLLVLTPPTYSSNNTADTPGGRAFISPAQVRSIVDAANAGGVTPIYVDVVKLHCMGCKEQMNSLVVVT